MRPSSSGGEEFASIFAGAACPAAVEAFGFVGLDNIDLPESPVICDPYMTPVRLDRARTTMEKTNDRIRTRVKSLRDAIDKAKISQLCLHPMCQQS